MPPYTRGKLRDQLTYVLVTDDAYFIFKTKDLSALPGISTSDITAIGHKTAEAVASDATKIRIVGASAPQPPRVTKKLSNASVGTQQSVSTFCGHTSLSSAQTAGWKVTKTRRSVLLRAASALSGSQTAIAQLSDGSLYCFPMNKADFDSYGATLKLKSAATEQSATEVSKLVSGSSIPRPGRATIKTAAGASFSSFYSSEALSDLGAAGFSVLSEELVLKIAAPAP
ncbi:hypothetical protein NIES4075_44560 [Tolypothrix sp. NIES-4075]|uniref:hypothetical protein n=1 Tax=Tolypothrix sp. NIES-4075 TaxID=2005459 RepID=UPI000B5CE766|nr:hypothetical protein [Tolypothrix sp. NIES-4075]GAX43443.1 hypothetical protein NIES4075_44560 [Tolypothrix sp. NIES-4075]